MNVWTIVSTGTGLLLIVVAGYVFFVWRTLKYDRFMLMHDRSSKGSK